MLVSRGLVLAAAVAVLACGVVCVGATTADALTTTTVPLPERADEPDLVSGANGQAWVSYWPAGSGRTAERVLALGSVGARPFSLVTQERDRGAAFPNFSWTPSPWGTSCDALPPVMTSADRRSFTGGSSRPRRSGGWYATHFYGPGKSVARLRRKVTLRTKTETAERIVPIGRLFAEMNTVEYCRGVGADGAAAAVASVGTSRKRFSVGLFGLDGSRRIWNLMLPGGRQWGYDVGMVARDASGLWIAFPGSRYDSRRGRDIKAGAALIRLRPGRRPATTELTRLQAAGRLGDKPRITFVSAMDGTIWVLQVSATRRRAYLGAIKDGRFTDNIASHRFSKSVSSLCESEALACGYEVLLKHTGLLAIKTDVLGAPTSPASVDYSGSSYVTWNGTAPDGQSPGWNLTKVPAFLRDHRPDGLLRDGRIVSVPDSVKRSSLVIRSPDGTTSEEPLAEEPNDLVGTSDGAVWVTLQRYAASSGPPYVLRVAAE